MEVGTPRSLWLWLRAPVLQERDRIRAAAMALFGDLVTVMAGREPSSLRTQVYQSMVPLLLHLKDHCPAVITVSARLVGGPRVGGPRVAGGVRRLRVCRRQWGCLSNGIP